MIVVGELGMAIIFTELILVDGDCPQVIHRDLWLEGRNEIFRP